MTSETTQELKRRVLDPVERLSEILFGLIMVLTFTGSLSVATAERADVREMLIGALGCNIAWGLIDAIMYLMSRISERGANVQTLLAIHRARSPAEGCLAIRDHLPAMVSAELRDEDLERIRKGLLRQNVPANGLWLRTDDFKGAFGVFLIVIVTTFPVVLPFIFVRDASVAMRLSNAIAIAMLALIGIGYARVSGLSPLLIGTATVLFGAMLVSLTIALGG